MCRGDSEKRNVLKTAMETVIDTWGFRYPGIKNVEHEYFWATSSVAAEVREKYLARAQYLGLHTADDCAGTKPAA